MKLRSGAELRVGLVGAGRWGANYLRALPATPGLRLMCVCDQDAETRDRVVARALDAEIVADLDALLSLVEAVVIATPSNSHARLAIRCLDAGKHVLVEKPLATDLPSARAVITRAEAVGKTLLVGHLTLCHPTLNKLRSLLATDAIGAMQHIEVTRTSNGAKHSSDTALWSLGPHDIANVLFATQRSVARVRDGWANGPDDAGLELELSDGVSARMSWSRAAARPERQLRIVGTRGSLVFDEVCGSLQLMRDGTTSELASPSANFSLLDRQCAQFVSAIRDASTSRPAEALQVVGVLAAVQAKLDRLIAVQRFSAAV